MKIWHIQGLRYIIVGITSNIILYLLYIVLTTIEGIEPKIAMTLLYFMGTLQTFFINRVWTFSDRGNARKSMLRYFTIYGLCYLLNAILLYALVDRLGWSHLIVQGLAIILVAILLFVAQRYWVFRLHIESERQYGA